MNPKSFDKIIKAIRSCTTRDHCLSVMGWVNNLRSLYNFSLSQKHLINEEYLVVHVNVRDGI